MPNLDHKHILINASISKPPTDPDKVVDWMKRVVNAVGMKLKAGPIAGYCEAEGNKGITAACCIETSHVSLHVWDQVEKPYLRFDLYSCAEFDMAKVFDLLEEFAPSHYDWMLVDRNAGLKVIDKGSGRHWWWR